MLAAKHLFSIMFHVRDNGQASLDDAIRVHRPVRQIAEIAWEAMKVFVGATQHINVAPPTQVAVTTLTTTLKERHTLLITILQHILETHNVHNIATDVLLKVIVRFLRVLQCSRKRVKSIAPVIVARARLGGSHTFVSHRAMICEVG